MGKYGKITLTETEVRYRVLFWQKGIAYEDLAQAYRQKEDARGSIG